MLLGVSVESIMKQIFMNLNFVLLDSFGFPRGLVIGCSPSLELINCFFVSTLCTIVHSQELGRPFQLLNLHGHYDNRDEF
jgi:hypothetical protein